MNFTSPSSIFTQLLKEHTKSSIQHFLQSFEQQGRCWIHNPVAAYSKVPAHRHNTVGEGFESLSSSSALGLNSTFQLAVQILPSPVISSSRCSRPSSHTSPTPQYTLVRNGLPLSERAESACRHTAEVNFPIPSSILRFPPLFLKWIYLIICYLDHTAGQLQLLFLS